MGQYSKAILVYGLALPGLVILLSLAGSWYGMGKVKAQKEQAQERAKQHTDLQNEISAAEKKLAGRSEKMSEWEPHLKGEVVQKITRTVQEILAGYPDKELTQIGLGRPASRSMLGGSTDNHYSRFQMSFEGGYGPMQQVLAAMELRMPHLVLEEFEVRPSTNSGILSFNVTFLCWHENPDQNQS